MGGESCVIQWDGLKRKNSIGNQWMWRGGLRGLFFAGEVHERGDGISLPPQPQDVEVVAADRIEPGEGLEQFVEFPVAWGASALPPLSRWKAKVMDKDVPLQGEGWGLRGEGGRGLMEGLWAKGLFRIR